MTIFNSRKFYFALICLLGLVAFLPAYAVEMPSEDEQDVLIRTTLMTFNDANMTGNYSVLWAKASKDVQGDVTPEKMAATFEAFRKKEFYIEEVVTAEYDSEEKAKLDSQGILVLAGVFKLEEKKVTYRLAFVQDAKVWKLVSLNVSIK